MTDRNLTAQIKEDFWTHAKQQMNGDNAAGKAFADKMNFLAICGDALDMPNWNQIAKGLAADSKNNAHLPHVSLSTDSSGDVYRIDLKEGQIGWFRRLLNPQRQEEIFHVLKRAPNGAEIRPINEPEACRALTPFKFDFRRSLAPRG